MTVKTTYSAKGPHDPACPVTRYVRACFPSGYAWCETALDLRYDIAQGTCDADDLPEDVREAADRKLGFAFSYVEWPRC